MLKDKVINIDALKIKDDVQVIANNRHIAWVICTITPIIVVAYITESKE